MGNREQAEELRAQILDGMESGSGSELDGTYFDRLRSRLEVPSPETTEAREEQADDKD